MSDWETVGTVASPDKGWETVGSVSDKPEEKPAPKGFWETLTAPGILGETTPAVLAHRFSDVNAATKQFNEAGEWDKERARRIEAKESLNGMENWKLQRINEIVKASKPPVQEQSFGQIFNAMYEHATTDPGAFAAGLIRGVVTAPELMFLPEALPLRMAELTAKAGKIASTTAKIATDAAQVGAVAGAESVGRQLVEHGETNPSQVAFDTVSVAAPIVALRSGFAALGRSGKAVDQPKIVKDVAERIKEGGDPVEATIEALKKAGLEAQEAVKIKEAIEPEGLVKAREEFANADEKASNNYYKSGGKEPWPQVRDEMLGDKGIAFDEMSPSEWTKRAQILSDNASVTEKLVDDQARARTDKAIAKDEAAEGTIDAIRKASGLPPFESGKIDPKLLAAMGVAGIGGAAGWLLNHDPNEAIAGALAGAGIVGAGLLLKRGASGVSQVFDHLKDTRYRITHLTDEHSGSVESARLANYRFTEMGKALVKDPKQREALTKYLQGDQTVPLTPEMKAAADALRDYFDKVGEKAQQAGILPDDLLDNYVTQLWTGLNKNDSLFKNLVHSLGLKNLDSSPGMAPRSRFAMKRVIPSYEDGMAKGLIPVTLDAFEIARIYGDNIAKAIANKNLLTALEQEKTPWGTRVMVRDTPDAIAKQIVQASAIVDQQMGGGGQVGQAIRDFAIRKAPKEFVTIDHPQMRGFKVDADIAPVLKNLFDAAPNAVTKAAYALSIAAKRGLFSYSFFHVKSLADALAGTGWDAFTKVANGDARAALKRGQAGDALDQLVQAGLKVVEKPLEGDVTPFTNALKLIEERHPIIGAPVTALRHIGKAMDSFLWSTVHPTFKTATALSTYEKLLMKGVQKEQAAKMAASYTNDIFGGLDWFRIADGVQNKIGRDLALAVTSPRGRQFMQIAMLAPDWTVATTRAMVKAIPGISPRELSALHQGYVLRSALLYATVADGLNLAFSGHHFWENEDPTMVDLGDGRRMQLSKHFMEPIHWLTKPGQQALNKLGYVIKEPLNQALNQEYLSTKGAPPIVRNRPADTTMEAAKQIASNTGKRLAHAIGGVMPITGQAAYNMGVMPALAGLFGFPVYGKTAEQSVDASKKRAESAGTDINKAESRERSRQNKLKEKRDAINR